MVDAILEGQLLPPLSLALLQRIARGEKCQISQSILKRVNTVDIVIHDEKHLELDRTLTFIHKVRSSFRLIFEIYLWKNPFGCYCLYTKAEQLDQFVALATFATTAEEFEQRARVHFAQKAHFRFQLAYSAHVFFQRHGRTYLPHQASTLREDEIRVIPLGDEMHSLLLKKILNIYTATRSIMSEPLDAQFDRMPALFAPEDIALLLWLTFLFHLIN